MKLLCALLTASAVAVPNLYAEVADTIRVADFGVLPGRYVNVTKSIQAAIDSCRRTPGAVLAFAPGRFDFWSEGAVRKEMYVSNTSSEVEMPDNTKVIPIHLYGLDSITVDGCGASLIFHGTVTPIAIDSCRNMTLK